MARRSVTALCVLGLCAPTLAQDQNGVFSGNEAPLAEGHSPPAPPRAAEPNIDVNVDLTNPGSTVDLGTFEEGLAPYGQWITLPTYGSAWRPRVAVGWRPYYYGRWEWTDEGWLWVSEEPWGWATYHYGRWTYAQDYGWIWIPGYQWAPAWVSWRYSQDYVGWAPLAPGFSVFVTDYPAHYGWWCFVPSTRFVGYPVRTVAYSSVYIQGLYRSTLPAPPRSAAFGAAAPAWGGPARPFLERRIGRPIAPVRVQAVGSPNALGGPGRPGVVPIYRPEARPVPWPNRGGALPSRPWNGPPATPGPMRPTGQAPGRGQAYPGAPPPTVRYGPRSAPPQAGQLEGGRGHGGQGSRRR
ncbi:MAG TPA: DUF6600 domain-containing protein [Anaeromyxobacteraceae bacterium]|nr:DUF6600 domain-containing protein [Anaeromyxobacteraceae bacterium]